MTERAAVDKNRMGCSGSNGVSDYCKSNGRMFYARISPFFILAAMIGVFGYGGDEVNGMQIVVSGIGSIMVQYGISFPHSQILSSLMALSLHSVTSMRF